MTDVARLEGRRVLVTRPRERAEALCFLLEDEGAEVVVLPLLELLPPEDPRPLAAAAEQVQRYRWVLFASPSAVEAFVEQCRQAGSLDRFAKVKRGAVGPATAAALAASGLTADVTATEMTGAGLFDAVSAELQSGDEVLLPAGQEGRKELEDRLEDLGARVTRVAAYRSVASTIPEDVLEDLQRSPLSAAIFASPRTVEAFLGAGSAAVRALASAQLVAIGPTTATALTDRGMVVSQVAQRPTPEALVEATVLALSGS